MKRSLPMLAGALLGAGLCSGAAHAQANLPGITNGVPTGPVVGQSQERTKRQAPPPALPGSRVNNSEPAPMERPPSDMRPTEALFDAVNRGDVVAVRDALSRGAELDAHNVLGLTPVDLSVDLGRNDITFLLLSMRGGGGSASHPAERTAAAKVEKTHQQARVAAARPVAAAPAARPATATVTSRQQYADVPGSPAPQSGFLGFAGSTTR